MKIKWFLLIFHCAALFSDHDYDQLKRQYELIEKQESSEERNQQYNEVLSSLLKIDKKEPYVNATIGALLGSFGEYALSSFYYRMAIQEDRFNQELYNQLNQVTKAGNLKQSPPRFPSLVEKSGIIICLLIMTFVFFLLSLFYQRLKILFLCSFCVLLLVLLIPFYEQFLAPIHGIVMIDVSPFQGPSRELPPVGALSYELGEEVTVLDVLEKGEWVKVVSKEGVLGYLPQDNIKLIP